MNMFHNPHQGFPRPGPQPQQQMQPQPQMPMGYDPRFPMNQQFPQQGVPMGYPQQYPQQMPMGYPQGYPQPQFSQQGYPQNQQFSQQGMPQQYPQPGFNQQMPPQMPQQTFNQPVSLGVPQVDNSARFGGNKPVPPMNAPIPQQIMNAPAPVVVPTPAPEPIKVLRLDEIVSPKAVSGTLTLGTRTTPYTMDDFVVVEDGSMVVDCVEEAIEHIVEFYYSDEQAKATKVDYVIINKAFGVKSNLLESGLEASPGEWAAMMKSYHLGVSTKNELMFVLNLDEQITSLIKDVLFINTGNTVKIDSFMYDWEDLSQALSGSMGYIAKEVESRLNFYRRDLKDALSQYAKSEDRVVGVSSPLVDKISLYYVDELDTELNLNQLSAFETAPVINVTHLKQPTNALYSLIDCIYTPPLGLSSVRNFIVTYNKSIFEVFTNIHGKYFVKRFN